MSGDLAERRKSRLMSLYAVAAAMIAIAAVTLGIEARSTRPNQSAGAVLPQLAQKRLTISKIPSTAG
jgi:Tfp pilus assembly protein PilN